MQQPVSCLSNQPDILNINLFTRFSLKAECHLSHPPHCSITGNLRRLTEINTICKPAISEQPAALLIKRESTPVHQNDSIAMTHIGSMPLYTMKQRVIIHFKVINRTTQIWMLMSAGCIQVTHYKRGSRFRRGSQ